MYHWISMLSAATPQKWQGIMTRRVTNPVQNHSQVLFAKNEAMSLVLGLWITLLSIFAIYAVKKWFRVWTDSLSGSSLDLYNLQIAWDRSNPSLALTAAQVRLGIVMMKQICVCFGIRLERCMTWEWSSDGKSFWFWRLWASECKWNTELVLHHMGSDCDLLGTVSSCAICVFFG